MEQLLTDEESIQLHDALFSAFRSQSALEQMVHDQLKQTLSTIAGGESYDEVLANLIFWAQTSSQIEALIRGARAGNASNICLQAFEERYRLLRAIQSGNVLTSRLRTRLVKALFSLPPVETFEGRSTLIIGIPMSALVRSATSAQVDLALIVDGLSKLGQLESGAWPLLILIENALLFVGQGWRLGNELKQVGDLLAVAYGVEWNVCGPEDQRSRGIRSGQPQQRGEPGGIHDGRETESGRVEAATRSPAQCLPLGRRPGASGLLRTGREPKSDPRRK